MKEKHDSRDSKRGDFYQAIVAIEYAIGKDLSNFEYLTIEHEGDVSFDNKTQIEVKHHKNKTSLADTAEDFWKTLYNWINQKATFNKLILHTTEHFSTNRKAFLKNWNKSNNEDKYKIIHRIRFKHNLDKITNFKVFDRNIEILTQCDIKQTTIENLKQFQKKTYNKNDFVVLLNDLQIIDTEKDIIIKECKDTSATKYKTWNYQRYIQKVSKNKLIRILDKINIKTQQPIDTELIAELMTYPFFKSIPCKAEDLEEIISVRIAGMIQSKVVGEKKWQITNKQFYAIIQSAAKDFYNDNYKPIFDKYLTENAPDTVGNEYKNKNFVKELGLIKCFEDEISEAIVDNWKTNTLLGEETKKDPMYFDTDYLPYRNEFVLRKVRNKKREYERQDIEIENLKNSLSFYRKAKELPIENYKSIKSYPYFEHGTMQNLVEDNNIKFSWII